MEGGKVADNILMLVLLGMSSSILLAGSVIFFYIRYQRRFLMQREQIQQAELRHRENLLHAVIKSQEEERLRISRDLHDHVGSNLSSLRLSMNAMSRLAPAEPSMQAAAEDCKAGIDHIMSDVRNISHSLFPPALALWGFQETLEGLFEQVRGASGIGITLADRSGGSLSRLGFDAALALYRVIQELLNNSLKHAQASKITLTALADGEAVVVSYEDNGVGTVMTREKRNGIGMYSIESRLQMIGAEFTIDTSPGNGFRLSMRIPPSQFKDNVS